MICPHCGKPAGTLKDEVGELHEQGLTPAEIREKLVSQGWGKNHSYDNQLTTIYHTLRYYLGRIPHKRRRIV